eukprot:4222960-Alexandrium_andersonii.AAC.1
MSLICEKQVRIESPCVQIHCISWVSWGTGMWKGIGWGGAGGRCTAWVDWGRDFGRERVGEGLMRGALL